MSGHVILPGGISMSGHVILRGGGGGIACLIYLGVACPVM